MITNVRAVGFLDGEPSTIVCAAPNDLEATKTNDYFAAYAWRDLGGTPWSDAPMPRGIPRLELFDEIYELLTAGWSVEQKLITSSPPSMQWTWTDPDGHANIYSTPLGDPPPLPR